MGISYVVTGIDGSYEIAAHTAHAGIDSPYEIDSSCGILTAAIVQLAIVGGQISSPGGYHHDLDQDQGVRRIFPGWKSVDWVALLRLVSWHAPAVVNFTVSHMPQKYRVISQAAPVAGKTKLDVHKALLKMNIKPEQIQLLLTKPLVIKKGLDNPTAVEYAERFSKAGLRVKVETYEVREPIVDTPVGKQRDDAYALLLRTFANPLRPGTFDGAGGGAVTTMLAALTAPLCYALLVIALAGVLIWYLGGGHATLFSGLALPSSVMTLLWLVTFLLPILAGATVLAFLLMPFWPQPTPAPRQLLDAKRYARFHHLINQITAAMDVAAPEFIEISPGTQIQVEPTRGILSTNRGDLRLVLGLAAAAGMTVQELSAVLAGQFGCFATRSSSMVYIWAGSINRWFGRHSAEKNLWDERLDLWRESYDWKVLRFFINVADSLIGNVRRLLASLLQLNLRLTSSKLRDIEAQADLYQGRVIGSNRFRALVMRLRALAAAEDEVHKLNHAALYQREQLLANIPAAVDALATVTGLTEEESTYIAEIESLHDSAMLTCELPARILFDNFDELCEAATLSAYQSHRIFDADRLLTANSTLLAERKALLVQARLQAVKSSPSTPVNADGTVDWHTNPQEK